MGLTIYHNPRCRKSRETLAILVDNGADVQVVEYLVNPPNKARLSEIVSALGIPAEQLIRKGEETFKANYKGKVLTETQWIEAMVENPILIERPIVVKGKKAVIGRPPENVLALL